MSTRKEELLKSRIDRITARCITGDIKSSDLQTLPSFSALLPSSNAKTKKVCLVASLTILAVGLLAGGIIYSSCYYNTPIQHETLIRWYLGAAFDESMCAVEMPMYVYPYVRTPTKCDFCKGYSEVDRVTNLSTEDFLKKYAYTGVPVVVEDATRNWTAPNTYSLKYFRKIYKGDALQKTFDACDFSSYAGTKDDLKQALRMPEDEMKCQKEDPWYFGWGNCADGGVGNTLRQHYTLPYFFPNTVESDRIDWIFMGCPGYGATLHVDSVRKPSWQAQVVGTKIWYLEPPSECYFECGGGMNVTLNTGDLMIVDTNIWYHSTLVVGDEVAIAIGSEYD